MSRHYTFFCITILATLGGIFSCTRFYNKKSYKRAPNHDASGSKISKEYITTLSLIDKALAIAPHNELLKLKERLSAIYDNRNNKTERSKAMKLMEQESINFIFQLANHYQQENDLCKSAKLYSLMINLHKENSAIYYNFAWALSHLGLEREALAYYRKVIAAHPNHAHAHYGLAELYLAAGDFQRGWNEFEWRQQGPQDHRDFTTKSWDGSATISGKKILVRCEYGLGDTIQFIRYTKKIKELGGYVIVEAQPPLIPLLSMSKDIDKVIPLFAPLPPFDLQIRLMSLARIFSPNEQSIPSKIPYLIADPQLTAYWKSQLKKDKNINVGLVWTGNKRYDATLPPLSRRSIDPTIFAPLFTLSGVRFYSLQTDNKQLPEDLTINLFNEEFDREHGRFMDTAAVIMNLDLIITIDTSIAHLAGALGKQVWVLLPYCSDWRWQRNRTDSPWYPTMQLFRQSEPGNWKNVVAKLQKNLTCL